MIIKIVIISIVVVAIATIGLSIKYYNSRRMPGCYRNSEIDTDGEKNACESCEEPGNYENK